VIGQLRSELLKQRSIGTNVGLLSALLGLVLLAVLLHGFSLPAENLASGSDQQDAVFGWGEKLSALFAGLLGAMSITAEIRHGTIRPTFLVTPRRGRVVAAKVAASILIGIAFGVIAAALAAAAGTAVLGARGIEIQLDGGDYALMIAGGAAATALWAAIGVGIGAIVRNQVPTLIGICTWLLLVEGILAGDLLPAIGDVTRFMPGLAASAISGQGTGTLLAPALGAVLLAIYAAASTAAGWLATTRRDVA
jgi:ABC-2 type transport system permease protein